MLTLAQAILGLNVFDQAELDKVLSKSACNFDKRNLRVNTILGISMAAARTAATALKLPLYRYLGGMRDEENANPYVQHFRRRHICREYIRYTRSFCSYLEKQRITEKVFVSVQKVYQSLKEILKEKTDVVRTGAAGDLPRI